MNSSAWRQVRRHLELLGCGRGEPDPQVGGDGVVEQEAVLEHDRYRLAQDGQAELAHVHAVQGHRTCLRVVKTGQ